MAKEFFGQAEREAFVQHIRQEYGGHSALAKLVEGLAKFQAKHEAAL